MNMSNESKTKALIPEGIRPFKIIACEEKVSKQNNAMFVFIFKDLETNIEREVYAVATEGSRWFLKSILAACLVPAAEDGVYEWDLHDVMEKIVAAEVTHYDDTWEKRNGEKVVTKKDKIAEVSEASLEDIKKYSDEIPF